MVVMPSMAVVLCVSSTSPIAGVPSSIVNIVGVAVVYRAPTQGTRPVRIEGVRKADDVVPQLASGVWCSRDHGYDTNPELSAPGGIE